MRFLALRRGERRDAWVAFLTLFALIASHSLLETARDALFLARIPSSHLPWVFLAIAGLSIALVKIDNLATRGLSPRRTLSVVTLAAGAITASFFGFSNQLGKFGVYALYVWSGIVATFVLVHFWALVGDRFTITQAKRLYGFIGAGSVLGAIVGTGAASVLAHVVSPHYLVLTAAVGFGVAGLAPLLFAHKPGVGHSIEIAPKLRETLTYVAQEPYARRVVATLFAATVCLTVSDFVFKSTVAAYVPKQSLGQFLGAVYFAANVLSLLCQVLLVARIVRRFSLGAALGVLPVLLVASGLGFAITAALAAVVALRAADGSLRYSLHRTTAELLVLPFGDEARRRVKAFSDLIAQRGGQVLASLAIIGFGFLGAPPRVVALVLVLIAGFWLVGALSLRGPYIALFRSRLNAHRPRHFDEFPKLDVSSLETLLRALESDNDREVLAAVGVLESEQKARLVPALLLHHPSESIVIEVLGVLTRSQRHSAVGTIDRISSHASPHVRAAALAARSVLEPDEDYLRKRLESEESEEVKAAINANLLISGQAGPERDARLAELTEASPATKQALAEAIGRRGASGFDDVLIRLLAAPETDVKRAAVTAMGNVRSAGLVASLIDALGYEATRGDAERALSAYGSKAFDVLRGRFEDPRTDPTLRWRIPAAMAQCSPVRAVRALPEWLPKESDGGVRFGILIVLERLVRQHPTLSVNHAAMVRARDETISRSYRFIDARLSLMRGIVEDPARKTVGHALLHDLLRDKERNARGRLFRILSLLHPSEDFVQIYRSLGFSKELRATGVELIESILREPVRGAVLGLVDDGHEEQRLERAGSFYKPEQLGYAELLSKLCQADSVSVREVAEFHASELGLLQLDPKLSGRAA